MNTITIDLSEADRARLDRLTTALEAFHARVAVIDKDIYDDPEEGAKSDIPKEDTSKPAEAPTPPPVKEPAPEPAKATQATTEPPAAPEYKLADVQRIVIRLCSPEVGFKAQTRTIIKQFADKVTNIPAEKYGEVMEKLIALEESKDGWVDIPANDAEEAKK